MINYTDEYNRATQRTLSMASQIDHDYLDQYDLQYSLHDITYVLRQKYQDPSFRRRYVGNLPFNGFVPWPKGFCALTAICIYTLYGGDTIWKPTAIKLGTWEHAPVVFLRDRLRNRAFDPTGDQFAPLIVPYDIGTPIIRRMQDMKTPNKNMFINEIVNELNKLDRR